MKEEHKKRLCELAGFVYYGKCPEYEDCVYMHCNGDCAKFGKTENGELFHYWYCDSPQITIEILIKAMWAINREYNNLHITMNANFIMASWHEDSDGEWYEQFWYNEYNNSEQQALEAALIYILEQEKDNG